MLRSGKELLRKHVGELEKDLAQAKSELASIDRMLAALSTSEEKP